MAKNVFFGSVEMSKNPRKVLRGRRQDAKRTTFKLKDKTFVSRQKAYHIMSRNLKFVDSVPLVSSPPRPGVTLLVRENISRLPG